MTTNFHIEMARAAQAVREARHRDGRNDVRNALLLTAIRGLYQSGEEDLVEHEGQRWLTLRTADYGALCGLSSARVVRALADLEDARLIERFVRFHHPVRAPRNFIRPLAADVATPVEVDPLDALCAEADQELQAELPSILRGQGGGAGEPS